MKINRARRRFLLLCSKTQHDGRGLFLVSSLDVAKRFGTDLAFRSTTWFSRLDIHRDAGWAPQRIAEAVLL